MHSHSFEQELQLLLPQTGYAAFAISAAVLVCICSRPGCSDFKTEVTWGRY